MASESHETEKRKTDSLVDSISEDLLSCGICMEHYTTSSKRAPKFLTCHHTYCRDCLSQIEINKSIECPHCRTITHIADGKGVDELQTNFATSYLLDIVRSSSLSLLASLASSSPPPPEDEVLVCQFCPEGCAKDVAQACITCAMPCCSECATSHTRMKAFQTHKIVDRADFEKMKVKLFRTKCKEHKEEDIKLYCETCHVSVCQLCVSTGHFEHRFTSLEHQAEQERQLLKTACESTLIPIGRLVQISENIQVNAIYFVFFLILLYYSSLLFNFY